MANPTTPFRLLAAAALLFALPVNGGELRYGAALHEAAWQVTASRMECRLAQEIPFYGTAAFQKRAGEDLAFVLQVRSAAPQESAAVLRSTPPEWMHGRPVRDIGPVAVARGETPITLPAPTARRLLADLEQGLFPTVSYRDWADGRDNVVVAVSALNLRKSLSSFYDCLDQLLPYQFKDVRQSHVHFGTACCTLDGPSRQQLARVAEYVLVDATVSQVVVKGYADAVGSRSYNRALSERRAKSVRDYLVEQGVDETLIKVEAIGEIAAPKAKSRTWYRVKEKPQPEHRRAEVVLER